MILGLLLTFSVPIHTKAQKLSIQEQIDASEPGDTIQLNEGEYEESIIINKPIHLVGKKDVTLIQRDSNPVITINANNAVIKNLHIEHEDSRNESPAILMKGNRNSLEQIVIQTNSYGIQLNQANNNIISHITIIGDKAALIKDRQHGIDIWESHNNEIYQSTMSYVQDGIYIENSNENKIYKNTTFQSRYGYHLMFTENTVVEMNESYENISGMMVMGANGTVVNKNNLINNRENIQSLGLLVFDTRNATITQNNIVNNRIGFFVEEASDNELTFNNVQGNYIGMQFKGAENNDIAHNSFIANVVQGQASESSNNHTNNNYWGDHLSLDMTGDEMSDLPYKVNPFFLNITSEYPPFQLLFESPGMIFLEQFIRIPVEQQLVDQSPLLENPLDTSNDQAESQFFILLICVSLFTLSLLIIYLGVKINEKV